MLPHPRDPGQLLVGAGGVNPEPPIPLPDHDVADASPPVVTTDGIGRAAGLTPFGLADTICGQRG